MSNSHVQQVSEEQAAKCLAELWMVTGNRQSTNAATDDGITCICTRLGNGHAHSLASGQIRARTFHIALVQSSKKTRRNRYTVDKNP